MTDCIRLGKHSIVVVLPLLMIYQTVSLRAEETAQPGILKALKEHPLPSMVDM